MPSIDAAGRGRVCGWETCLIKFECITVIPLSITTNCTTMVKVYESVRWHICDGSTYRWCYFLRRATSTYWSQDFQTHFLVWQLMYLEIFFIWIWCQQSTSQYTAISSDNGLEPNRGSNWGRVSRNVYIHVLLGLNWQWKDEKQEIIGSGLESTTLIMCFCWTVVKCVKVYAMVVSARLSSHKIEIARYWSAYSFQWHALSLLIIG